jgi:putative ABC transport system permease protein
MLDGICQDLRYAFRSYRKAPAFVAGVVATIGFGLGFVCSAFTVVNGYLLKPFDLPDPYALHELSWDSSTVRRHQLTIDDWSAVQSASPVFSDVVAFTTTQVSGNDGIVYGQLVTGNYFDVLGVRPFLGRLFASHDAPRPGAGAVAVLSHSAWLAHYGADPSIIGREVRLGRSQFIVLGIAQPGFTGFGDAPISFFVPVTMAAEFPTQNPYAEDRPAVLNAVARVRQGISVDEATAWFTLFIKQRLAASAPEDAPVIVRVEPRGTRIPLTPATTTFFSAVVMAFGLVLLIACANVANLMLARGLGRQREIAVRLSVGASRWRLIRQLLFESALCALPAALLGYAITRAAARVVPAVLIQTWPEGLPPIQSMLAPMEPDSRVVLFLMFSAIGSVMCFGLSPALQTTNTSLARASRGEFGERVRSARVRNALVVGQIAACALFLVTASQLLGELNRISNVVRGINVDYVADLRVGREYRARVVDRLVNDPRVASVATAWRPPFYGPLRTLPVTPEASTNEIAAGFMVVSPEYFPTMDIAIVRGRAFSRSEADARANVAVISEATAHRLWPNGDGLGQTLHIGDATRSPGLRRPAHTDVRIVGVARDVISGSILDGVDRTCVYFPTSPSVDEDMSLLIRTRTTMPSLQDAVNEARVAVREDAAFPFYPMRQVIGLQVWAMQMASAIVSLLAAGALLLAFSGTYSVMAYLVSDRMREFGIRMALGASVAGVVRSVLEQALRLGVSGTIVGGSLALALSTVLASLVEIMPAPSAGPYLLGAFIILLASAIAAVVPSHRAARVDPAVALRTE